MRTVTLEDILNNEIYVPLPGMKYEVARGCVVTLREPRRALVKRLQDLLTDEEALNEDETEAARLITEGEWPSVDDILPRMVGAIVEDFLFCALPRPRMRRTPSEM